MKHLTKVWKQSMKDRTWTCASGAAAAICIAGMSATPASSETQGEYGVHLGYSKAAKAEDGDFLVGGHLEARLAPALGIQVAVDYHSTDEYALGEVADPALQVRTIPITVSARAYLPVVGGFSPFLVAGGGWHNVIYDYPDRFEALGVDDETVSTFGWHLGLGGRVQIADRVAFYGEGRYTFVDPSKELGDDVRDEIGELDYDRSQIITGLSLEF